MVSIIIPHHLNRNQHLLDGAIESILSQCCDFEIIVIADTPECPKDTTKDNRIKWFWMPENPLVSHFCKKINYGISLARSDSLAYMIVSDDVVLGKNALPRLADFAVSRNMILNATSNCDVQNFINPVVAQDNDGPALIMATHKFGFYATMIPKRCYDLIGPLDETFESGYEDDDYCLRASYHGVRTGILLNAFIYHHGSRTVMYENREFATTPDKNRIYFNNKWHIDVLLAATQPQLAVFITQGMNFPTAVRALARIAEPEKYGPTTKDDIMQVLEQVCINKDNPHLPDELKR